MEKKCLTSPSRSSSCNALMAVVVALLVLMSSNMVKNCSATRTTTIKASNSNFIKSCCASTRYPKLCYSSLSSYSSSVGTSRAKLAIVALKVSLNATHVSNTVITKLSKRHDLMTAEKANIKVCVVEVRDAVSQLKQSLEEMKHLGGSNFEFNKNNIQTWTSASLTDDQTCLDGLSGFHGKVEKKIIDGVTAALRLTSNALAIVNSLTKGH